MCNKGITRVPVRLDPQWMPSFLHGTARTVQERRKFCPPRNLSVWSLLSSIIGVVRDLDRYRYVKELSHHHSISKLAEEACGICLLVRSQESIREGGPQGWTPTISTWEEVVSPNANVVATRHIAGRRVNLLQFRLLCDFFCPLTFQDSWGGIV